MIRRLVCAIAILAASAAEAVDFAVNGLAAGQVVTGPLRVNAVPSADTVLTGFTFFLLNAAGTQLQSNPEGVAPYCFVGDSGALPCNPYNTASRPDGAYTLRIEMRHAGGTLTKNLGFVVANQVPAQPPGKGVLTALRVDVVSWTLTWDWLGSTGDLTTPEVERAIAPSGPFTLIASLPAGSVRYDDVAIVLGQAYWYRLRGRIGADVSPYSNVVTTP